MASLLKRRCNRRTPLAGRSGEHVGDEKADGLRPLILVGARGAAGAALRNPAEVVLAHHYPQFAEPAALALAQRLHSLSRRFHWSSPSVAIHENRLQDAPLEQQLLARLSKTPIPLGLVTKQILRAAPQECHSVDWRRLPVIVICPCSIFRAGLARRSRGKEHLLLQLAREISWFASKLWLSSKGDESRSR